MPISCSGITEKAVKQYFLKFGSVASVATAKQKIKRTRSKRAPWFYALVTFEKSESARKALGLAKHDILCRRVKVKATNSWIQPRKKEEKCEANKESRDESSEMGFRLLHLNDDCLCHIASYLELRDLLNLSKTCPRLECGLEPIFASHKKLDVKSLDGLTLVEIHEILYKIGPHVQHLVCSNLQQIGERLAIVKYGNQYRPPGSPWPLKLYKRNANFVSKNITSPLFKRLIKTFKNLRTLKCAITDDMSGELFNCKNLQNLHLCEGTDLIGNQFNKLINLEFFKNLCMKSKLVSLNIIGCDLLYESSIKTLASTQTKLENLSMCNDYFGAQNLSPLARLKNLKRLRIHCCGKNCDEFFQELAKHRGAELEVLGILGCPFNQKVEQAIYSLKKLKVLSVHYSENITNEFLTKLAMTPLECLAIQPLESILEEGVLNLISKSETIKVIVGDTKHDVNKQPLVLSAYEIIKKKERKYPFSLFTAGPCIIDGIYHDEPELDPQMEFRKIIRKLGYLNQSPWCNDFYLF